LIPFRGAGGSGAGTFKYFSASDVVTQRIAPGLLKDKIVLLGTTAPGLLDLRVTPVGETYPGVEVHANMISGLLDGRLYVRPDYAVGFEVLIFVCAQGGCGQFGRNYRAGGIEFLVVPWVWLGAAFGIELDHGIDSICLEHELRLFCGE
jgi:CHASE2 domain-containing sensor protein